MKKINILSVILLSFTLLIGCNKNNDKSKKDDDIPEIVDPKTPSGKTYNFEDVDPREHLNPISISNENDLIIFQEKVNNGDETYKKAYVELSNDITLTKPWKPISNFSGQFNGNNHKISGLTIEGKASKVALFSEINSAKIGCFSVKGDLDVGDNSSFVVGYTIGDCTLLGITIEGKLTGNSYLGGIVGTISDGSLKIVGCINASKISGKGSVGGILGANKTFKVNISDCANYGVVIGSGSTIGGIAASLTHSTSKTNDYNCYQCYNYGTVKGNTYVGGVVGLSCCQLLNCGVDAKAKVLHVDGDKEEEVLTLTSFVSPYCSTLCGSLLYNTAINEYGELIECVNKDGFAVTGINDPAGCTRIIKFKDKIMLFSATNRVAISNDGGHTFGLSTVISNKTTEICPIDGEASTDTGNTQPYILPDGRIAMMYRSIRKASTFSYGSLRMRISDQDGVFDSNNEPIILCENYTSNTGTAGAFYEPYPILLDDGTIAIYISEDVHYTEEYIKDDIHIAPLDTEIVCPGGSQNTVMIPLKVAPNATEVGEGKVEIGKLKLIFKGSDTSMFGHSNSRPGMTVITQLHDGSYAMILENSTEQQNPGYNLVIQITYSQDGRTWTAPRTIIRPHQNGGSKNGDGKLFKCCAPFIATLPDGRLVIVCATDEDYQGLFPTDDAHYKHEIAFITKNRISYNDNISRDEDLIQVGNYSYSVNEYCVWASCAVIDGRIYVSGLQGVNYTKNDGTVGSPTDWMLISSIYYQDLYNRLGITEIK